MNGELKTHRGAPYGNQNARKYGFYSQTFDKLEQKDYEQAVSVPGVDEEITLLRLKLKSALTRDPQNMRLIEQAFLSLTRLLRVKKNLSSHNKELLKEAISAVLRDIALPLGVDLTEIPR